MVLKGMCYRDLGNEQSVIYFKVYKHVRTLFSRKKKATAQCKTCSPPHLWPKSHFYNKKRKN